MACFKAGMCQIENMEKSKRVDIIAVFFRFITMMPPTYAEVLLLGRNKPAVILHFWHTKKHDKEDEIVFWLSSGKSVIYGFIGELGIQWFQFCGSVNGIKISWSAFN